MFAELLAGALAAGILRPPSTGITQFSRQAISLAAAHRAAPGNDGARVRLSLTLARTYRRRGQYKTALALLASLAAGPWPSWALKADYQEEVARNEEGLGRLKEALAALQKSLAAAHKAEPGNDGARVRLSLALARTYRRLGQYKKALDLLATLAAGPWPSPALEADYQEEIARDEAGLGRLKNAIAALQKSLALAPTAERHFRLGQLAGRVGDQQLALSEFEAAVRAEPKNAEYKTTLAYRLRSAGNLRRAAQLMTDILASEPNRYALHEDLGYVYLGLGENDKAIHEFKWVIDNSRLLPAATPKQRATTERMLAGLRQTISSIEPHWTASGYANLCLAGSHCDERGPALGSIISNNQGGLELSYQPPGIGYVDGRTFDIFARTFFNFAPGTVDPQEQSFQGGVGVRFKPLREHNLVLSGERWFKLGSDAQNNWLARASFSASSGFGPQLERGHSWYRVLYVDLASTLEAPHQYFTYVDARAGPNFRLANRLLIAPFAYGTFRGNFGVGRNVSAETGIGFSLRGFLGLDRDKYHASRGAVELLSRLGYEVYDSRAPEGVVFSLTLVAGY